MAGYLYEVSHGCTGPIEELVKHLGGKAAPKDTILVT
jgi:hypothetical protein